MKAASREADRLTSNRLERLTSNRVRDKTQDERLLGNSERSSHDFILRQALLIRLGRLAAHRVA